VRASRRLVHVYKGWAISRPTNHNPFHSLACISSHVNQHPPPITDDLLATKGHLTTRPSHVPGNFVAAVRWHAIRVHYHVSRVDLSLWVLVLTPVI